MIALALDGPFNGEYLSELSAKAAGYELVEWPTGEEVWMEGRNHLSEPTIFSAVAFDNVSGTFVFDD